MPLFGPWEDAHSHPRSGTYATNLFCHREKLPTDEAIIILFSAFDFGAQTSRPSEIKGQASCESQKAAFTIRICTKKQALICPRETLVLSKVLPDLDFVLQLQTQMVTGVQ